MAWQGHRGDPNINLTILEKIRKKIPEKNLKMPVPLYTVY